MFAPSKIDLSQLDNIERGGLRMVTQTHSQTRKELPRVESHANQIRDAKFAYTIPRTAELVSVSRSQVYVEIQTGRLSAVKVGGRTLVLHDDLIAWLKSRPRKRAAGEVICRSESER